MEEELIPLYFRKPGPDEVGQFFPNSLIMSYLPSSYRNQLSTVRIGQAMKKLGFEPKRTKYARGWICIPRTPAEIEAERKRMAREDDYDDSEEDELDEKNESKLQEATEAKMNGLDGGAKASDSSENGDKH
jgi:hypothetical protein